MQNITVFGASDCKKDSEDYLAGKSFGKKAGEKGYNLVTGGYAGIMEAVFAGASPYETKKIAVITDFFTGRKANKHASAIINMPSYIDRMVKLIELGDIFVVFPGGPGTLTELGAVWTLRDRNAFDKPIIVIGEQWEELLELFKYYSEKAADSASNLIHVKDEEKAFEIVDYYFTRK